MDTQESWQPKPQSDIFHDRWISYPQAEIVLDELGHLLSYPDSVRTPGILIYGPSNSGKTMLTHKFKRDVDNWYFGQNPKATTSIVQLVETPPDKPTPKAMFKAILRGLNAPFTKSATSDQLLEQVLQIFHENNVQMLIIDELHNIGTISHNDQLTFLNALKYLSNVANVRIVCVGIEEAYRVLQLDQQLGSRFQPYHLQPWSSNDPEYAKFIIQLIQSIDFPFIEEHQTHHFLQIVHDMTNGLTGETKDLITSAAHFAKTMAITEIGSDLLKQLNWVPPASRYR